MTYTLVTPDGVRHPARTLAYAQCLAPQLLKRMGTAVSLHGGIVVILRQGKKITTYSLRNGWQEETGC